MKKFLTVLLVIAVMFTFSFGSAFAANYTKDQIKDTLQAEADRFVGQLDDSIRNQVLNSYSFNDDDFFKDGADNYYSKNAINEAIDAIIDEFADKAEQAIESGVSGDMDTIPYQVVQTVINDYDTAAEVKAMVPTISDEEGNKILYMVSAADLKAFVQKKLDEALTNLDKYSDKNAENVVKLVNDTQVKFDAISPSGNYAQDMKAYSDLYYTASTGFKAQLDAIPTLEKDDNIDADKEVAVSKAVAEFTAYGLDKAYAKFKATADSPLPADYSTLATDLDEIYEKGSGNSATVFGVKIANVNKVTTSEATALNRALRTAILDAADAITAYANTEDTSAAATAAVEALYTDENTFMKSLNKAVKAIDVYAEVVELGEDYKAANVYGVKTYNDENVDKAVKKAEELVYADLAPANTFKTPAKYIEDAAKELDITIEEVNFELQKFEAAIDDAVKKMYSNTSSWTVAKKVTYGEDKTPEADYVYLRETYATDTKTGEDWEKIAKGAVADLLDAESYAEIDEILANAAKDFSALTLRVDQKAVETAKTEYKKALAAYKPVHEALIDTSKYPSAATADVVTAGEKLIDEATSVDGVQAAYEEAKTLFNTLKTKEEVKALEDALKASIKALETTNLTVESKAAVMAVYEEYLAFVQTPGVDANDITGESKIEDALKEVLRLEAKALQDEIDAMVKALDKVDAISDVSMASYVALKDDVKTLIEKANAFNDEVKAINDVKGDTEFAEITTKVNADELEATVGANVGATGHGFWTREVTLVESALVQAAKDGATGEEMKAALDAFKALTDRQQYSIDSHALQMVSVISIKLSDSVESLKITASSKAAKGSMTINWKVTGDASGVEAFEIWKSTKKSSGFKKSFTTTNGEKRSYKNTKELKKGTRYYYKVRAIAYDMNGKKITSDWSNKARRIAK